MPVHCIVNTLRPRQDGRLFPDDIFKSIFFHENVQILIKISLTFVPKAPINNIPALLQIMAWRRPGDKPLSESMMVSLFTHICVTRPQWVNAIILLAVPPSIDVIHTHCTRESTSGFQQIAIFKTSLICNQWWKSAMICLSCLTLNCPLVSCMKIRRNKK